LIKDNDGPGNGDGDGDGCLMSVPVEVLLDEFPAHSFSAGEHSDPDSINRHGYVGGGNTPLSDCPPADVGEGSTVTAAAATKESESSSTSNENSHSSAVIDLTEKEVPFDADPASFCQIKTFSPSTVDALLLKGPNQPVKADIPGQEFPKHPQHNRSFRSA